MFVKYVYPYNCKYFPKFYSITKRNLLIINDFPEGGGEPKRCNLIIVIKVPRYLMDMFRNKLKLEEIKEELTNCMDIESERKMTPQKIKEELDKFIIGQDHVKRAIAIALSS